MKEKGEKSILEKIKILDTLRIETNDKIDAFKNKVEHISTKNEKLKELKIDNEHLKYLIDVANRVISIVEKNSMICTDYQYIKELIDKYSKIIDSSNEIIFADNKIKSGFIYKLKQKQKIKKINKKIKRFEDICNQFDDLIIK